MLPFDSGLDYEEQPVKTQIVFDWFEFNLEDVGNLEKVNWDLIGDDCGVEVSIYLGSAHNPCDIKDLKFKKIEENVFEMKCDLYIDFEHENVAEN